MSEEVLREILGSVVPAIDWSKVPIDQNLESAGLDSLDKANFIMEIESVLSVTIDDSYYEKIETMSDILNANFERSL